MGLVTYDSDTLLRKILFRFSLNLLKVAEIHSTSHIARHTSNVAGYSSIASLSHDEVQALPDLIALRILRLHVARHTSHVTRHASHVISNVVYFVGRAVSGEDSITSLTSRAGCTSHITCHTSHITRHTSKLHTFSCSGQYLQRLDWLETNR